MTNYGDVTGPRWVGGVNAPASGGGDYEALVKWLRDFEGPGSNGTHEAADAIEALAAERDEADGRWTEIVERTETGWRKTNRELVALQRQLDGMTAEWGTEVVDVDGRTTDRDVWDTEEGARRVARQYGDTLVRRLVSPWTAVEDAEGVSDGQQ